MVQTSTHSLVPRLGDLSLWMPITRVLEFFWSHVSYLTISCDVCSSASWCLCSASLLPRFVYAPTQFIPFCLCLVLFHHSVHHVQVVLEVCSHCLIAFPQQLPARLRDFNLCSHCLIAFRDFHRLSTDLLKCSLEQRATFLYRIYGVADPDPLSKNTRRSMLYST